MNKAFSQIKFWSNFSIFDPWRLPEDLLSLEAYVNVELEKHVEHYGNRQSNKFDGTEIYQEPDVSIAMAKVEWESFKNLCILNNKNTDIYTISLIKAKTEEERETLTKAKDRFGPHELRKFMKSDVSCKDIFPHCTKLLYFLSVF